MDRAYAIGVTQSRLRVAKQLRWRNSSSTLVQPPRLPCVGTAVVPNTLSVPVVCWDKQKYVQGFCAATSSARLRASSTSLPGSSSRSISSTSRSSYGCGRPCRLNVTGVGPADTASRQINRPPEEGNLPTSPCRLSLSGQSFIQRRGDDKRILSLRAHDAAAIGLRTRSRVHERYFATSNGEKVDAKSSPPPEEREEEGTTKKSSATKASFSSADGKKEGENAENEEEDERAKKEEAFEKELQTLSNQILLAVGSLSLGFMTLRFFVPRFGPGALIAAATFVGIVASVLQGALLWPAYVPLGLLAAYQYGWLQFEAWRLKSFEQAALVEAGHTSSNADNSNPGSVDLTPYETNKVRLSVFQAVVGEPLQGDENAGKDEPSKPRLVIRGSRKSIFHAWAVDSIEHFDAETTQNRTSNIFAGRRR
ncbi:unnamed protein product [Amoebophrya sp. A25]|nr:unnamed protein product [Amoebophrya sp. A25]|eukprot:GSA25T00014030001.1